MNSMKNSQEQEREKVYVDPILIKEGFFDDEEDYVRTMDEMFKGLREAAEKRKSKRQNGTKQTQREQVTAIKPGPKRIAESTGKPDRRQRDNKKTPGNTPSLKPHKHKKGD